MRACALPLSVVCLTLAGCHGIPSFPETPRVLASEFFEVTTDLGDPIEGVLPLLDDCYEDMCARWEFPLTRSPKRNVILFADEYDFRLLEHEHDFPASRTGKCAGFFCTRCDAMVTYFRPGKTSHHPFDDALLAMVDGNGPARLAGVLAHEMNHQLLYEKVPGVGERPAWLLEGVAELESVRLQSQIDAGFLDHAADGHSAVRTTLACLNLAAYQLYGNRAFADDQATWKNDRYDLHLAACLALDDIDAKLLRRLLIDGPEGLEALEASLRTHSLVLATETLARLLFDRHSRFGAARVNVYEVLALLWDRPDWATFSADTRRAWRGFTRGLRERLAAGSLRAPPGLTQRQSWKQGPLAAQARAHGAIQRLLLNFGVPANVVTRWLEDLRPPVRPPSMSGRVLTLGRDGPEPAPNMIVRAFSPRANASPQRGAWGLPRPVARWRDARARAGATQPAPLAETTTDADGGYVFEDLPSGDYQVIVTRDRDELTSASVQQQTGDLGRLVHVPLLQTALVRPVDNDGAPILDARVVVCDASGDLVASTSSWRDDGTVELTFVAHEWLWLWVTAPGFRPAGGHIQQQGAPGATVDLGDVTPRPGGARIVGHVVSASGDPPSQTVLIVVRDTRTRLVSLAEVKHGAFVLDGLRAGRVELEVFCWKTPDLSDTPERLGPKVLRLDRAAGGTATITLELPRGLF